MAADERARHQLYDRLVEVLGEEDAATLMQHVPPVPWTDVATAQDVGRLEAATTDEFARVRQEMADEFTRVRQEMADEFTRVRQEMADEFTRVRQEMAHESARVRQEMAHEFALVRREMSHGDTLLRQEIALSEQRTVATLRADLNAQTRTFVLTSIGTMVSTASLAFGAARLV
jgi:hypothetical protein